MKYKLVRVYNSIRGELPWTVDFGPDTKEWHSSQVAINKPCITLCDPTADKVTRPDSWFSVENATVTLRDNYIVID